MGQPNSSARNSKPLAPLGGVDRFVRKINDAIEEREAAEAAKKSIEIMVAGDPAHVGIVRNAVNALQQGLLENTAGTTDLRITAFMDNCRHSTGWSNRPSDVGGQATWDCFRGRTMFAQALAHNLRERNFDAQGQKTIDRKIDAIVIYGDHFSDNDDLDAAILIAKKLHEKKGTRIIALHVGDDVRSQNAYERIAAETGGVCLQLTDQRSLHQAMPIITDFIAKGEKSLARLEAPNNPDLKRIVDGLRALPPQANS